MKLLPNLCTRLVASAFLLSGTLALAQASSAARETHPRDSSTGLSTGREAAGSPHATTPTPAAHTGSPLYHEGSTGTNPLYEPKDKAAVKPQPGVEPVQYKDPEDMTTRYRPGNNKTTRMGTVRNHTDAGGRSVNQQGSSAATHRNH